MASSIKELRDLSADELTVRRRALKEEALNLRVQRESGQIENTARIRVVRRDIARIETLLSEKRSAAQVSEV
ncbi:MAG: 50S ribosomal protein L29 [Verrucomicrobiota bacterium]